MLAISERCCHVGRFDGASRSVTVGGRSLGGAVAVAVVLLAQLTVSAVTNPRFDWPTFGAYLVSPTILEALWFTIQLTAIGAVLVMVALMMTGIVPNVIAALIDPRVRY